MRTRLGRRQSHKALTGELLYVTRFARNGTPFEYRFSLVPALPSKRLEQFLTVSQDLYSRLAYLAKSHGDVGIPSFLEREITRSTVLRPKEPQNGTEKSLQREVAGWVGCSPEQIHIHTQRPDFDRNRARFHRRMP